MDVICDTSFFIVLVTKPTKLLENIENIFGKINFLIPDVVIEELMKLVNSNPRRSRDAKLALEISKKFKKIKTSRTKHIDDNLVEYAYFNKCAVATIDKDLIRRLISQNTLVISLRKNKIIVVNN